MKFFLVGIIFLILIFFFYISSSNKKSYIIPDSNQINVENTLNSQFKNEFYEDFSEDYVLEEVGNMNESLSDNWWVNSGAFLYSKNGIGRTSFGKLKENSKWQKKFSNSSNRERVIETENGFRPQNIFRLVTRKKWKNFTQEAYFRIHKYNLSKSEHRKESNGILLFNRYKDGNNLYYAGLRVDGYAIIKKKINGKYITLVKNRIFEGEFSRDRNPNLLPLNKWIGVKTEVKTIENDNVSIKLFLDLNRNGNWKQVLEVVDRKEDNNFLEEGFCGIRTDFMDVEFDDYKIIEVLS